jgi:hypothetical protein
MSIPRHSFNTLPAKPEYISKVLNVLSKTHELNERDLALRSGLTKTQSLCALLELIKVGKVAKNENSKCYRLTKIED